MQSVGRSLLAMISTVFLHPCFIGDYIKPVAFTLQHSIVVKQESAYRGGEDIVAPSDYPCACGVKEQKQGPKKRAHQSSEVQIVRLRCPSGCLQMPTGVQLRV